MKKADFMTLVGKNVEVILFDGEKITGKLFYVDECSAKYCYRKPGYFGIEGSSWAFRFSHVEKVRLIE